MPNNRIVLHEVEEIGAWNNFKNICYVLEDIKDDIKKLSKEIHEQQRQIHILARGLEATVIHTAEIQQKEMNIELPRWMKHETPNNTV